MLIGYIFSSFDHWTNSKGNWRKWNLSIAYIWHTNQISSFLTEYVYDSMIRDHFLPQCLFYERLGTNFAGNHPERVLLWQTRIHFSPVDWLIDWYFPFYFIRPQGSHFSTTKSTLRPFNTRKFITGSSTGSIREPESSYDYREYCTQVLTSEIPTYWEEKCLSYTNFHLFWNVTVCF